MGTSKRDARSRWNAGASYSFAGRLRYRDCTDAIIIENECGFFAASLFLWADVSSLAPKRVRFSPELGRASRAGGGRLVLCVAEESHPALGMPDPPAPPLKKWLRRALAKALGSCPAEIDKTL
ncbi:hypothetical protein ZHAS_00013392 [Anopheles sinensis]|uniref:Uncharacterized protein n=1 Tax=Anopheles sinensis TaxID=74873 RepID=A0A084W5G1_ANOSI|nr:hypothetical protein ZHAS_00013392 [Anopheles sinensis]